MPGAGKQSAEVQDQIKELLEAGFDPTTIHRRLKVGRSSIYRMKRCLQQHGTAYMPVEMNKKNGRPKVLTAEQELEVREWLRDPKNRNRYLDDLVWLIHDRFGIVCSTTTMSKMKRKWLRVIECEETGQALDSPTRQLVLETHPDLPILRQAPGQIIHDPQHQMPLPSAQMVQQQAQQGVEAEEALHQAQHAAAQQVAQQATQQQQEHDQQNQHQQHQPEPQRDPQHDPMLDSRLQADNIDSRLQSQAESQIDSRLLGPNPPIETSQSSAELEINNMQAMEQQNQQQNIPIDARLEQQIHQAIASAEPAEQT